jgi:CDP-6-deoxy-D-xylo-4-hexulose-3-dehydrase
VASEIELRNKIKSLVNEYYQEFHKPQFEKPFEANISRVNYAGRVFDEKEMLNLTDATLDFWLTSGRFCDEFESKLAKYLGVKYALLVNSGSSANLIAFSALTSYLHGERRIKKGDEVITVAAGFPTTVTPIIQFGAVPVFLDITVDDGTYEIDVNNLERALSSKTKAVMIAHTLGNAFNLKAVSEFCKKHNLWLVEDNCDALGSKYDGKFTGTFGDIATSSFYPPHHMTMGEGGAVYMNNPLVKKAAESFRDWGRDCWCASGKDNTCKKRFGWKLGALPEGYDHKYTYSHFGYNLKATEMQASIGVAQLEKLDFFVQKRRENFNILFEGLKDLEDFFILPAATKGSEPSWFGFMLTIKDGVPFSREEIVNYLEEKNIQTRMLFAGNLIRHPAFNEMRESNSGFRVVGELKQTDRVATKSFWVGVYPGMKGEALAYMVKTIREFVSSKNIN